MAKTKQKANYSRRAFLLAQFPHIHYINDEKSSYGLLQVYVESLHTQNYSDSILKSREIYLCELIDWCAQRQVFFPEQVSKQLLDRYQRQLFYRRKANGEPLSFNSQCQHLIAIRKWFLWLMQQDYTANNPAGALQLPRKERRLPKAILSESEVECLLRQPDTTTTLGLRDRAMLETFYSTGVRRTELARLKITDVDLVEHIVMVRQGKGKKDRMIPMGERAAAWVKKYVYEARVELSCSRDNGELFLSAYGLGLTPVCAAVAMKKHLKEAGINKVGSCHLLRHAMATHMLEHGADIRFIQAMLGHSDITSTQVYTQVSMKKLREVHSKTHPASTLKKKVQEADVEVITLEESEDRLLDMLAEDSVEGREENL